MLVFRLTAIAQRDRWIIPRKICVQIQGSEDRMVWWCVFSAVEDGLSPSTNGAVHVVDAEIPYASDVKFDMRLTFAELSMGDCNWKATTITTTIVRQATPYPPIALSPTIFLAIRHVPLLAFDNVIDLLRRQHFAVFRRIWEHGAQPPFHALGVDGNVRDRSMKKDGCGSRGLMSDYMLQCSFSLAPRASDCDDLHVDIMKNLDRASPAILESRCLRPTPRQLEWASAEEWRACWRFARDKLFAADSMRMNIRHLHHRHGRLADEYSCKVNLRGPFEPQRRSALEGVVDTFVEFLLSGTDDANCECIHGEVTRVGNWALGRLHASCLQEFALVVTVGDNARMERIFHSPLFDTPLHVTEGINVIFLSPSSVALSDTCSASGLESIAPEDCTFVEVVCSPKHNTYVYPTGLTIGAATVGDADLIRPNALIWGEINDAPSKAFPFCHPARRASHVYRAMIPKIDTKTMVQFKRTKIGNFGRARCSESTCIISGATEDVDLSESTKLRCFNAHLCNNINLLLFLSAQELRNIGAQGLAQHGIELPEELLQLVRHTWCTAPPHKHHLLQRLSGVIALQRSSSLDLALMKADHLSKAELQEMLIFPCAALEVQLGSIPLRKCLSDDSYGRSKMLHQLFALCAARIEVLRPLERRLSRLVAALEKLKVILLYCSKYHYRTLQRQCRHGNHISEIQELRLTPLEWRSCFREGDGCRDEMIHAIMTVLDRRCL